MGAEISTLDFETPSGKLLATMPTAVTMDLLGEQTRFFEERQISMTSDLQSFSASGSSHERRFDISLIAEDPTGGL